MYLTSGKAQLNNGNLDGFRVQDGKIAIAGKGLDTSTADFTRILSRAAEVNAGIWANDLQVVTGNNELSADGQIHTITPAATTHGIAIDTGNLGGMYADKITLISTEKGVGVNNAGQIFVGAGGVKISADGKLENSGSLVASDKQKTGTETAKIAVSAKSLANSGQISAQGKAVIVTERLHNTGTIASTNELSLTNKNLNNQGQLDGGRIAIDSATLKNTGKIQQTGLQALALTANTLKNSSKIGYPEAAKPTDSINNPSHPTTPSSANTASTPTTTAMGGGTTQVIISKENIKLTDGAIQVNGELDNSGAINANGGMDVTVKNGLDNQNATLNLHKLTVQGAHLSNQHGKIDAEETDIQTNSLNNQQGIIRVNKKLAAQVAQLDNSEGKLHAIENADLNISKHVNNQKGEIAANHVVKIHDNQKNTLNIDNVAGKIVAGNDVFIQSKSLNNQGKLAAGRDLSIKLTDDFKVERDLEAGNTLSVHTQGNLDNRHNISAGSAVRLQSEQNINNRGTINSNGLTRMQAKQELLNIGTGKIYGNHVALAAETLTNSEETTANVTKAAVIAARERLDIGAKNIQNLGSGYDKVVDKQLVIGSGSSLISSEGNLSIGQDLDASNNAIGQANFLLNQGAKIESAADMNLNISYINNINNNWLVKEKVAIDNGKNISRYQAVGNKNNEWWDVDKEGTWHQTSSHAAGQFDFNNGRAPVKQSLWIKEDFVRKSYEDQLIHSEPAQIIVGGNLIINANEALNQNSQILVGHTLLGNANQALTNDHQMAKQYITETGRSETTEARKRKYKWRRYTVDSQEINREFIIGEKNFDNHIVHYSENTQNLPNLQQTAANLSTPNPINGKIKSLTNNGFKLPNSSLYTINPKNSGYLIETDPAFSHYRHWLGSDYMLSALKINPNHIHKRLGDGYYEQKLVNEQINRLTGYQRLDGYQNSEDQLKALMDNGLTVARELNLSVGVALTAEQVARLTSDIIWLETQTITLDNGSTQTVLVPKVYVVAKKGDLNASGSLISADKIHLNVENGVLQNGGTLGARQAVVLNARDINHSGHLQAQQIGLQATNNIQFSGGSAQADKLFSASANNIDLSANIQTSGDQRNGNTVVDRVAAIYVRGDEQGKGNLILNANNDLNLNAAVLNNDAKDGRTQLSAKNDVRIATMQTQHHETYGELND